MKRFTDLDRNSQFALLAFAAFLGFLVYFGFMISSAQASIFDLVWRKAGPAAPKPYDYVVVRDVDQVCRQVGAKPMFSGGRINGCALVRFTFCRIYLPEQAPQWIVEHEEKHCEGWVHD